MSGYKDSNLGPPAPKAGALTGLRYTPKKETQTIAVQVSCKVAAFYSPALAVPSTLQGLTSLFGMVRGGALVL